MLINCTVTAQLICTFVLAYATNRFSQGAQLVAFLFLRNHLFGIDAGICDLVHNVDCGDYL